MRIFSVKEIYREFCDDTGCGFHDEGNFVKVEEVRNFIKKFFLLDEGETNNLLCEFDKEIGYDSMWL